MGVALGVLTELGVKGPVPLVLTAPALPDQSRQCIWAGAQAGDEPLQTTPRVPLLVLVVVMSSTIQAVPGQLALIC